MTTQSLDTVWYTRCPVPTASGLALHRGTLAAEFTGDGLAFGVLQDGPAELARHHFDHQLVGLFREGGNVPALAARSEGAPSRLIEADLDRRVAVDPGPARTPASPTPPD
ncbi:hypothetical protein ACU686_33880 [Yinghuangia aomiensis]